MELGKKITKGVNNVRLYWKKPPKGRYMSYKEVVSLAGGAMGIRLIVQCVQAMMLSVGNVLIGNVIGIPPGPLYAIYVLSIIASFPLTGLRAGIIDNTKSKKGKYRPYIISMGLPTVILAIGFVWMPYDRMSELVKCIVVLAFNIGFQFFYMFFYDVYDNLINVLSSNTQERADVNAVRNVVESFAPSIVGIILPLIAHAVTGKNTLVDIRIYRVAYPPMLILGMILAIVVYANTEEKIIQAKTHVIQIKFIDAFRAVARNKYFWIISLAGWLGFLEGSYGNILLWLYSYQGACSAPMYSLITTLYGNASLWGMLFAPFAIRRFGKRKVLIFINTMNIFFIALLYPVITLTDPKIMIWLVLVCMFMNTVVSSFSRILTPSINGDIRDYQQYVTGERIDGMFAAVALIGSVLTLATSGVLPALYAKGGINETKLAELLPGLIQSGAVESAAKANVYDVLYNVNIFEYAMGILIGASVVGAILNVIPYFFYDLTELKQRGIVKVLQIRAMFEDYGNGALSDKGIVETIDLINESKEYAAAQPKPLSKQAIKEAKKSHDKTKIKAAKKDYRDAVEFNKMIQVSQFVVDEMNRFGSIEGQAELEAARQTYNAGINQILNVPKGILRNAKQLPKNTEKEKAFRKAEIAKAKDTLYAQKAIRKYYPHGLVEFDMNVLEALFEEEDKNLALLNAAFRRKISAEEKKDRQAAQLAKDEIKMLRQHKKEIEQKIKKATNENAIYHRAAKPYLDAKKLLAQAENYRNYEKITSMYEDAKQRKEAEELAKSEKEKQHKAEKAALAASLKTEKKKK